MIAWDTSGREVAHSDLRLATRTLSDGIERTLYLLITRRGGEVSMERRDDFGFKQYRTLLLILGSRRRRTDGEGSIGLRFFNFFNSPPDTAGFLHGMRVPGLSGFVSLRSYRLAPKCSRASPLKSREDQQ